MTSRERGEGCGRARANPRGTLGTAANSKLRTPQPYPSPRQQTEPTTNLSLTPNPHKTVGVALAVGPVPHPSELTPATAMDEQ
jgi:hypothetical protein